MIRTPLIKPKSYFEWRSGAAPGFLGLGIALLTSAAFTALMFVTVDALSQQLTGTAEVDSTVTIGEQLRSSIDQILPMAFVGLLIVWFLLALLLWVGAQLTGGDGSVPQGLEIAAWGMIPSLLTGAISAVLFVNFASQLDLSSGDPDQVLNQLRTLRTGTPGAIFAVVTFGGLAWQMYVWSGGLQVYHDVRRRAAWGIAGILAFLLFLVSP